MSYIRHLCLLAHSRVQRILCNVFGVFCPRLGYPMLKVSLDCPFFIASLFFSILASERQMELLYTILDIHCPC